MNVKKTFCILIGLTLVLTAFSAAAMAGTARGQVQRVTVHAPGVVMFDLGNHSNKPACSGREFAFSLTTSYGKSMYALLLSAANLGAEIYAHGNGRCDAWGDRENVVFILMDP